MSKRPMPRMLNLVRGNALLGTIEVKPGEADLPWHSGTFHPSADFELVRALFDQELRILRANSNDDSALWDEWEGVHEKLHEPGLRLETADRSYTADEILIHIENSEAWWRSD